ncbi:MAG TPA: hypothetical protein VFS15_17345 [Kofleriaceae bacterium]|nr:hypothetical protein [Kofleriaceae bacterium]
MRFFAIVFVMALSTSPAGAQRWHGYAPPFTPAWAAPQLHVDPPAGAPGTVVRIGGARFHRGVRVFYGDQPMQILERGDRYVVAVIPPYARRGDFIYVVDNTGRARTRVPFEVTRRYPRHRPYTRHRPYVPPGRY